MATVEIRLLTIVADRGFNSVTVNEETHPDDGWTAFAGGIQFPPGSGIRMPDGELRLCLEGRLDADETQLIVTTQAEPVVFSVKPEIHPRNTTTVRFEPPITLELMEMEENEN